jgi:VWFA-related protein
VKLPRTQGEQRTQRNGGVAAAIAVAAASFVPFVFLAPLTAQQQPPAPPVFRAGTRLIVQTVSAKDKDGRAVEGLTPADFVVTEDGEPQTVSFVEFQRLSDRPADSRAATPAPQAPAAVSVPSATQGQILIPPPGDTRYHDARLLVLYFDLTAMPPADQIRAYAAAQRFIDAQMQPSDRMAIMTFGGGAVRVKQDFTADRGALREAIQTLIYGDDKDGDGIPDNTDIGTAFGQDDAEFSILNTDRQLSALQTAATMLRALPEQKALIYFASGLRLNGVDNQAQLRATTNAAIRANVALHPIDARGLVAQAPLGDATRPSPGGLAMFTGQLAQNALTSFQRSQDTLYSLAKDTGGRAMFDYNDLSLGIAQAAQSMTSYYMLGYYSTHPANDGRFHKVRISLRSGTGELAYRQGYFSDKEFAKFTAADKERQLEEALMLDNPVTDISIAMELNYFQLNSAEYFVPVAVKIPGSELALARRRGAPRTLIDFIGEIKDDYGITVQNVRDKLDIKLSDDTAAQLATRPLVYETGFTLLPGRYVIKLLARDEETGRIGTYQASFAIPNLNKELQRVPISTVVLSSQRVPLSDALYSVKQKAAAEASNPLVHDGQKLVPSITRVFSRGRDLYVFAQAYQRGSTTTQPLVAFVSFYRGEVKAFETAPMMVTEGLDAKTKAVPLRFSLPLESFATGRYDCQVTVIDPTAGKIAFWRAPIVIVR